MCEDISVRSYWDQRNKEQLKFYVFEHLTLFTVRWNSDEEKKRKKCTFDPLRLDWIGCVIVLKWAASHSKWSNLIYGIHLNRIRSNIFSFHIKCVASVSLSLLVLQPLQRTRPLRKIYELVDELTQLRTLSHFRSLKWNHRKWNHKQNLMKKIRLLARSKGRLRIHKKCQKSSNKDCLHWINLDFN